MQKKILFYTFFATLAVWSACSTTPPTNSDSATADNTDYGSDIFRKNCVSCHGMTGDMGFNGAANLQKSTLTLEERVHIITNGKKVMTAFKSLLSEKEIEKVAEYTMTLKK